MFLGSETVKAGNERRVAAKPRVQVERSLTKEAWAFAMRVFDTLPDSASAARMRFVLAFARTAPAYAVQNCAALLPTTPQTAMPVRTSTRGPRRLSPSARLAARSAHLPGARPSFQPCPTTRTSAEYGAKSGNGTDVHKALGVCAAEI